MVMKTGTPRTHVENPRLKADNGRLVRPTSMADALRKVAAELKIVSKDYRPTDSSEAVLRVAVNASTIYVALPSSSTVDKYTAVAMSHLVGEHWPPGEGSAAGFFLTDQSTPVIVDWRGKNTLGSDFSTKAGELARLDVPAHLTISPPGLLASLHAAELVLTENQRSAQAALQRVSQRRAAKPAKRAAGDLPGPSAALSAGASPANEPLNLNVDDPNFLVQLNQRFFAMQQAIDDQNRTIDDQNRTIDDQNRTIDDLGKAVSSLSKDLAILTLDLAYRTVGTNVFDKLCSETGTDSTKLNRWEQYSYLTSKKLNLRRNISNEQLKQCLAWIESGNKSAHPSLKSAVEVIRKESINQVALDLLTKMAPWL